MPGLRFDGRLESDQEATFIRVPAEVLEALGRGKRMPVKVTLNGYTYRSTVAVYGGRYYLPVRREVRQAARVQAGDELSIGLEYDAELRTVDLPEDLQAALAADAAAAAGFGRLSFTRKKETVMWLADAKLPATRRRRLGQVLRMLRPDLRAR
jgi:Domain of unknown function (DUF1905)/Bacteriocin-protection, YdeI or OmpD-Associated